ncbi:TRAFAC clade GTPase domain-containing protein [Tardiphaga sp. 803_E3_N1_3]|uniref:TRAFAC clade GTPase domain-containing protein n=1 Tax=Tardiphaga sp. 803_E3_N1_3 TaxID=3240785 RepID=UPI003F262B07
MRPIVIGVIGPQNAGKTTLLAAWYMLLGRGLADLNGKLFAGSYTLSGWEAVAGAMRWSPGQPPRFPPHTTSRGGRAPGLLHLTLRDPDRGRSADFLFTDAPGEWFQKWALNTDSQEGVGARWVSENADAFLVVADREALSGGSMGSARSALQLIAKRLGAEYRGRPVALVWTKADVTIAQDMVQTVRTAVTREMPDAVEFSVSVVADADVDPLMNKGNGLVDLLRWAVETKRAAVELPPPVVSSQDPLFIYRNRKQ